MSWGSVLEVAAAVAAWAVVLVDLIRGGPLFGNDDPPRPW